MFTEDLTPFFSTSDFGVAASYNDGGGAETVNGIFDHEYVDAVVGGTVVVEAEQPIFFCKTADVAANPVGDSITISSTAYTIEKHEPDGTGVSKLILSESS